MKLVIVGNLLFFAQELAKKWDINSSLRVSSPSKFKG